MVNEKSDTIGGFPYAEPNCRGCGNALTVENAWMTDGCPCNSPMGVNSQNETRWRLLMELQQRQERIAERSAAIVVCAMEALAGLGRCTPQKGYLDRGELVSSLACDIRALARDLSARQ